MVGIGWYAIFLASITSLLQVATRKRTAFGDITNAIQDHANRMAQARSRKSGVEKPFGAAPTKTTTYNNNNKAVAAKVAPAKPAQPKRTSNRLKTSKSTGALAAIPIYVDEDAANTSKTTDDIEMTTTTTKDDVIAKACVIPPKPAVREPFPAGLEPFDLSTDPDHVCEYAHSIFKNMRKREGKYPVSAYLMKEGRMSTGSMRAILVDWLVEVWVCCVDPYVDEF